ncbi:MAG TPA: hypothetical protein VHJ38_09230 [Nitrososphaeraceae archaeon]|nr:hypothetical protein [Nitrososphaeraceae archaeon]
MINFYDILEYFLICLFPLKQISYVGYILDDKKYIDAIKYYNYNSASSETSKNVPFQVANYSYLT